MLTIDISDFNNESMIMFAVEYGNTELDTYENDSPFSHSSSYFKREVESNYVAYIMPVGAWVSWGVNSKRTNRILRWRMDRYFRQRGFKLWNSLNSSLAYIKSTKESDMLNNFIPDLIDTESGDQTVADYQYRVSNPGKFESNPAYVPYMWDNILEWGDSPSDSATAELWRNAYGVDYDTEVLDSDDIDLPYIYRYDCDLIDYVLFPELIDESIVAVYLYEDSQGFVNVWDTQIVDLDVAVKVEDIDPNFMLITDSQDIQAVGESIGRDLSDYGGLFVEILDGEYGTIYGYSGAVPYNYKSVDKIQ